MSVRAREGEEEDAQFGANGLGGSRGGIPQKRSSFALIVSREIEEADLRLVGDDTPVWERLPWRERVVAGGSIGRPSNRDCWCVMRSSMTRSCALRELARSKSAEERADLGGLHRRLESCSLVLAKDHRTAKKQA